MKDGLTEAGSAVTELVLEVFRLYGLLQVEGDDLVRPAGLTSARWQVLGAIEQSPMPVASIARVMGLSRQAVQQTANALERDGFIEYRENLHHSRAKLVTLTPKAHQALQFVATQQARWANELGGAYTPEQLQETLTLLRRLSWSLDPGSESVTVKGREEASL